MLFNIPSLPLIVIFHFFKFRLKILVYCEKLWFKLFKLSKILKEIKKKNRTKIQKN